MARRFEVSKPDITAPGVQILAGAAPDHVGLPGGPQGELFQAIAGTSMSSPHIAGSGALVKALHPSWTPGQIKSALMTTAQTAGLVKEDGTTPFDAFDAGSGRVNLNVAGDPGLTFDATGNQYLAAEDHLYTANYPSIYHPTMPGLITLSRTAHSVLGAESEWTLTTSSPSDFKISVPHQIKVAAGKDKTFKIKLDAAAVALGQTRFGTITLTQTKGGHRVLHMPVTIVRGQEDVSLSKECAPTNLAVGATTSCTITATNPTFDNVTYTDQGPPPSGNALTRQSQASVGGRVPKGRTPGRRERSTIPAPLLPDVGGPRPHEALLADPAHHCRSACSTATSSSTTPATEHREYRRVRFVLVRRRVVGHHRDGQRRVRRRRRWHRPGRRVHQPGPPGRGAS